MMSVRPLSVLLTAIVGLSVPAFAVTAKPDSDCGDAMDVGGATKVGIQREGENLRLVVEPPNCPNLKVLGIWKALELSQGSRQLTGKIRGLSGPYAPGEKAIIGRNLSDTNPFLEPGDLAALKGALSLRGTLAIEYAWQKPQPVKARAAKARKIKKGSKQVTQAEPIGETASKVRINLPVSVEVQPASGN